MIGKHMGNARQKTCPNFCPAAAPRSRRNRPHTMHRGLTMESTSRLPRCILRRLADRAAHDPIGPGPAEVLSGRNACGQ
jgi:hypothetical protein